MKIIIISFLLGFINTPETYGQSHLKKDALFTGTKETGDYSNLKVDKRAFKSGKIFQENCMFKYLCAELKYILDSFPLKACIKIRLENV